MKKNQKGSGAPAGGAGAGAKAKTGCGSQPGGELAEPGAGEAEELTEASTKNRTLYLKRLKDEGVPLRPIVPVFKQVRHFQLAHLAATLARGTDAPLKACELADSAVQLWNASGKALFVETQAAVMVKGLFCLDRDDWGAHGRALIASLDDLLGAVPGHNRTAASSKSLAAAQGKAGLAVYQGWNYGPGNDAVLKGLFTGGSESERSRGEGFVELLKYAGRAPERCEKLKWKAKDSDLLKWCMLHAWEPLGVWDEVAVQKAVGMANDFLAEPENAAANFIIGFSPLVARWLAVMRQEQLVAAKTRR